MNEIDFIPHTLVYLTDDYFIVAADEPSAVIKFLNNSNETGERFNKFSVNKGDNPVLEYYRLGVRVKLRDEIM